MVGPYGQVRDMVVYVYMLWSVGPPSKKDTIKYDICLTSMLGKLPLKAH